MNASRTLSNSTRSFYQWCKWSANPRMANGYTVARKMDKAPCYCHSEPTPRYRLSCVNVRQSVATGTCLPMIVASKHDALPCPPMATCGSRIALCVMFASMARQPPSHGQTLISRTLHGVKGSPPGQNVHPCGGLRKDNPNVARLHATF